MTSLLIVSAVTLVIPAIDLGAIPAFVREFKDACADGRITGGAAQRNLGAKLARLLDLGAHHPDPLRPGQGFEDEEKHAYTLACLHRHAFDTGPYLLAWKLLNGILSHSELRSLECVEDLMHGGFCTDTRSDRMTGTDNFANRQRYGWHGKENIWWPDVQGSPWQKAGHIAANGWAGGTIPCSDETCAYDQRAHMAKFRPRGGTCVEI
jgi:hypothetical protein